MTEINTNNQPSAPSAASQASQLTESINARRKSRAEAGPQVTNAQANSIQGLASGLNTRQIMDTIIQVERRRLLPVEDRRAETQVELDAFNLVRANLETLQETSQSLADRAIWEGKIVESSDESVIKATATTGAKPGKNTLVVDRLALNHQIASQRYEESNDEIGTGSFKITVGEGDPLNLVIDPSNGTLNGLKSAINKATEEVNATIINTGEKELPYQLVLTSQKTGSEGRIILEIDMSGGKTPSFESSVDDPSDWKGVDPERERAAVPTDVGASTTIIRVIGENTSEDEHTFNFTAVQTGIIGGESALQMRWRDETGRSGVLELDTFNYVPGEPIEFADGLSLIFSQGEIIVGDDFTVRTRPEKSSLLWWLTPDERAAGFTQPSPWKRQGDFGVPLIEGPYSGPEDQSFRLTVQGSGQIGAAKDLSILWESEDGLQSGSLRVGVGYQPGTKLALIDGLTITLKPGVLTENAAATFSVTASETSTKWWLDDAEREIPSEILNVTNFVAPEVEDEEVEDEFVSQPDFPEELGPRRSSSAKEITGTFTSDEAKIYTFTATRDGSVGTTKDLIVRWEDDKGNSGQLSVGDDYLIGSPLSFDSGLSVSFGAGRIFDEDSFTVRTRTSTIQPAQDALIRFGATELGGGLEITNPTNILENVIPGVRLELVTTSEKPVTITVTGDTETATDTVLQFAEHFNEVARVINELTKFDPDTNEAGPLLGDSDLSTIRNDLSRRIMDPVPGLPVTRNMLFGLGMKVNDKGLLDVDEEILRAQIAEDFAGVADVFRAKGESDNTAITFINMTEDTRANPDGYEVDITSSATRGSYLSPPIVAPIVVDVSNSTFVIRVDGSLSEEITVAPGTYSVDEYARQIQNGITNDEAIGTRRVRVSTEGDRIRVISGRFGSRSKIAFEGLGGVTAAAMGLSSGESEDGTDVQGTIGGEPAVGVGQLLRGADESDNVKGLRLIIGLPQNQLIPNAPEGSVKITKGVGSRLAKHIKDLLDPRTGNIQRVTNGLRSAIDGIDNQLEQLNDRIERKRERLQIKFAKLEGKLSRLRAQQNTLGGQAGGLPKIGGGGGAPGLPGL